PDAGAEPGADRGVSGPGSGNGGGWRGDRRTAHHAEFDCGVLRGRRSVGTGGGDVTDRAGDSGGDGPGGRLYSDLAVPADLQLYGGLEGRGAAMSARGL